MKKPMPNPSAAIRKWLLAQPEFMELLQGGTVSTRDLPDPLTKPHVLVAVVGHAGPDPMLRRVIVQVTPWVPNTDVSGLTEDPDTTAWRIGAAAGELLGRAKNQRIDEDNAFSAVWLDGPIQLYDEKRGKDRVLFYAPVRFQVHIRHR
ncbi:hypothetical protein QVA66_03945 [Staphylococcus chromogenes]|nr:hypothetical protein [Staphylococcus chromogenes]